MSEVLNTDTFRRLLKDVNPNIKGEIVTSFMRAKNRGELVIEVSNLTGFDHIIPVDKEYDKIIQESHSTHTGALGKNVGHP